MAARPPLNSASPASAAARAETMAITAICAGNKGVGEVVRIRTVRGSFASTLATLRVWATKVRSPVAARARWIEKTTSSAVTGVPS